MARDAATLGENRSMIVDRLSSPAGDPRATKTKPRSRAAAPRMPDREYALLGALLGANVSLAVAAPPPLFPNPPPNFNLPPNFEQHFFLEIEGFLAFESCELDHLDHHGDRDHPCPLSP